MPFLLHSAPVHIPSLSPNSARERMMRNSSSRQPSLNPPALQAKSRQPLTPPLTPAYTLTANDRHPSAQHDHDLSPRSPPNVLYSTYASRSGQSSPTSHSSMVSQLSVTDSTEPSDQESATTDHRTSIESDTRPSPKHRVNIDGKPNSEPPTRCLLVRCIFFFRQLLLGN